MSFYRPMLPVPVAYEAKNSRAGGKDDDGDEPPGDMDLRSLADKDAFFPDPMRTVSWEGESGANKGPDCDFREMSRINFMQKRRIFIHALSEKSLYEDIRAIGAKLSDVKIHLPVLTSGRNEC